MYNTMNKNNYCVIMAGGIGSRFWPLSITKKPKQFIDILGVGKTLLQQTFSRFKNICPVENIYIVTGSQYFQLVSEQLPDLQANQILLEPQRKNTAPCIAYASYKILKRNAKANIIVAPSDHLILNESEFNKVIEKGLQFSADSNALLTLGIKPNRAETGYGYIQLEEGIFNNLEIKRVKTFTEKPNKELAKKFLDSGQFLWNSGIFIWSVNSIISNLEKNLQDVNELFKIGIDLYDTEKEGEFIKETYSKCRNISIDYGIMEKAKEVHVLCSDFGWSDLGTWGSLFENSQHDSNNNVLIGNNIKCYDTNNCIVNISEDKLIVVQGLDNYIIAESDNKILIIKKDEEQRIRNIVDNLDDNNK